MADVFTSETTDGNTDATWAGGDGYLIAKGVFDGCSITVVGITDDDGVEIAFEKEACFKWSTAQQFSFPEGKVRGKITNAGTSTSVTLQATAK